MICDACGKKAILINNSLRLCGNCSHLSSLVLISKSDAVNRYLLSYKDLQGIRFSKFKNPDTGKMNTFHLIDDVENVAKIKHGGRLQLLRKIKNKNDIRKDNIKKQVKAKNRRIIELNNHLHDMKINCSIKNSMLCQNYIEKGEKSGYDINTVINVLKEKDFYDNHTNYQTIFKQMEDNLKQDIGSNFDFYFTKEDKEDLQMAAKDKALREYVKDNFLNLHKMLDEIPYTLIDKVNQYSSYYYKKSMDKLNIN